MEDDWFRASLTYWQGVDATVHGMLGGFTMLHTPDIRDSRALLARHVTKGGRLAMDVGAGIGRVSSTLLAPLFERVSVLESDGRFVSHAAAALGPKLQRAYPCRLQEYRCEEPQTYDLIWIQWVLMYASDDDLLGFLAECRASLTATGIIGIKENTLSADVEPVADPQDRSVVRSDRDFRQIFDKAGLRVVDYALQRDFPAGLFPVRMYILKPQ